MVRLRANERLALVPSDRERKARNDAKAPCAADPRAPDLAPAAGGADCPGEKCPAISGNDVSP